MSTILKSGRCRNSEDRHISPKGTCTRVKYRNVMIGDIVVLRDGSRSKVIDKDYYFVKVNRYSERFAIKLKIKKSNGKSFTMEDRSPHSYITIIEYPKMRVERRRLSRL